MFACSLPEAILVQAKRVHPHLQSMLYDQQPFSTPCFLTNNPSPTHTHLASYIRLPLPKMYPFTYRFLCSVLSPYFSVEAEHNKRQETKWGSSSKSEAQGKSWFSLIQILKIRTLKPYQALVYDLLKDMAKESCG